MAEDVTDTARDLLDLPFHRANGIEVVSATEEGAGSVGDVVGHQ